MSLFYDSLADDSVIKTICCSPSSVCSEAFCRQENYSDSDAHSSNEVAKNRKKSSYNQGL